MILLKNQFNCNYKLFSKKLTKFQRLSPLIASVSGSSYSTTDSNGKDYQLYLYNHYTRSKELVKLTGDLIPITLSCKQLTNEPLIGTVYICGPTVYDYCHIGHAMSYTRFDIFRRFLQTYGNVNLVTAMNITDIDDKIMKKAAEEKVSYRSIGDKYFSAFLDDLQSLNILPVDSFVRVTDHIDEIIDYIGSLEVKGYAYINSETNDVNFDTSKVNEFNDKIENITDKSKGKKSSKDFALWRSASNEPLWVYTSPVNGQQLKGRPGWHIECSVIASWLFGSSLDFHFGGKDLIFPHHFCESVCSSCYFDQINKQSATNWASHWFHSSHVKIAKEKMSKSIGNVITIKDFIKTNSPDLLRIMCLMQHYRSDIDYDGLIIKRYGELDRRFKQFNLSMKEKTLSLGLNKFRNEQLINCQPDDQKLSNLLKQSTDEILSGAANDWDLEKGLNSILEVINYSDSLVNPSLIDLNCLKSHVNKWMNSIGLSYPDGSQSTNTKQDLLLITLINHRNQVRTLSLESLIKTDLTVNQAKEQFKSILKSCDNLRAKLDSLGYVIKDSKFKADN